MSQSHPAVLTQTESDPGGVAVRVRKLTKHFGAGDQRVQNTTEASAGML